VALRPSLKRTKIIATIGPASSGYDAMEALIKAGANGLRLNMSHGTHDEHAKVIAQARRISAKLSKPIAVIVDLQGPKIRLGQLPPEGLVLRGGSEVTFTHGDTYTDGKPIPIQHDISKHVKVGHPIFLRDGLVEVEIKRIKGKVLYGKVLNSGLVYSKQGINLPDTDFAGDIMTAKDIDDLRFAVATGADYVALSFVQTPEDIKSLRRRLLRLKAEQGIIAKIETKAAVGHLGDIIAASDGVMVARGDLAVETRPESVPVIQKRAIDYARNAQKIAIVATQMLESMISSPQPTRAEVQDVATAVVQGADCVMLSGETAMGKYPIETVALMRRVIVHTETNRLESITATSFGERTKANAISAAAIALASQMEAQVILAETSTGQTARNLCSFRPESMVVAVTHSQRVYQQLALVWGARSYVIKDPAKAGDETMRMLREEHEVAKGDTIIRASGQRPGVTGGTDTVQVQLV